MLNSAEESPLMNWLDLVLGIVLVASAASAMFNGLTHEVVRIAAVLAGLFGGIWFYRDAGGLFAEYVGNESLRDFAGFAAIVLSALAVGALITWAMNVLWKFAGVRWFDRLLGGAFGLARGFVLCAAIVLAMIAFVPVAGAERAVANSAIAPIVLHGAQATVSLAPQDLRRKFASGFDAVQSVWSGEQSRAQPAP